MKDCVTDQTDDINGVEGAVKEEEETPGSTSKSANEEKPVQRSSLPQGITKSDNDKSGSDSDSEDEDAKGTISNKRRTSNTGSETHSDDVANLKGEAIIVKQKATVLGKDNRHDQDNHLLRAPDGYIGVHRKGGAVDTKQNTEEPHETPDYPTIKGQVLDSESSIDEQVTDDKRKKATLKIDGSAKFCRIESVKYKYDGKTQRQHYVDQVEGDTDVIGDLGLRKLDEIIKVNGKEMAGKRQKYVKKQFKEIRLKRGSGEIKMHLELRRWISDGNKDAPKWVEVLDVDIQLTLVRVHETPPSPEPLTTASAELRGVSGQDIDQTPRSRDTQSRKLKRSSGGKKEKPIKKSRGQRVKRQLSVTKKSEKFSNGRSISAGNIRGVKPTSTTPNKIKIQGTAPGKYVAWDKDGVLCPVVLKSNSDEWLYNIQAFYGADTGPMPITMQLFGCRICNIRDNASWFLHTDLANDTELRFKTFDNDSIAEHIDERCFITRHIGEKTLLQSLIYRDYFVLYDKAKQTFTMKEINKELLEAFYAGENDSKKRGVKYDSAKKELNECWFHFISPPRTGSFTRFVHSLVCGSPRSRR